MDISFLENYSKNEREYYTSVSFNKDGKINKWETDIIISFDKRFDDQFKKYAEHIIAEIDSLIPNQSIRFSDSDYNILVLYEDSKIGSNGLEQTKFKYIFDSEISESTIWLSPSCSPDYLRYVFCHEFIHALGFYHALSFSKEHSLMGIKEFGSIDEYESFQKSFYDIPNIDKVAIQIHYSDKIRCGTRKKDFINALHQ